MSHKTKGMINVMIVTLVLLLVITAIAKFFEWAIGVPYIDTIAFTALYGVLELTITRREKK